VKNLESERVFKWKDAKVFLGEKELALSEDEYVILTKKSKE